MQVIDIIEFFVIILDEELLNFCLFNDFYPPATIPIYTPPTNPIPRSTQAVPINLANLSHWGLLM